MTTSETTAETSKSDSPPLIRRRKYFKPTWRGNYVPDSDQQPEEEEEVQVDASAFQKRKDVIIGEKTVTELRAALERIVSKPKEEAPATTQQQEENNLVIVEKDEEKELIKWLDMLCDALNVLLVTAPPLAESFVIALNQQVNDRLDRIYELEQVLGAGLDVVSGDEIHLSLVEQLDWLDEQRKLWKTLGEVETPSLHTHATPSSPTHVASRATPSSPSSGEQHRQQQQINLDSDTLREQKMIVESTTDMLKSTIRNSLHNSPIVDQLLSGLFRAILDNKVDAFWKSFRKQLKKKKASKQTIQRVKELPFLVKEQVEQLTTICNGIKSSSQQPPSSLCIAVRKSLESEQEWLDARLAAMSI